MNKLAVNPFTAQFDYAATHVPYVFNVVDEYGADKTGTNDATTAIQAAITAAAVNGGIVFLPPGTYLLNSSALTLASNVTIMGSGKSATTLSVGTSFSGVAMLYQIITTGSFTNFSLTNLTVDGTALSSSVHGFQLDTSASNTIISHDILLADVIFQNCYMGFVHGGNNANAGGMINNLYMRGCTFIANSFGVVMNGSYGDWLDHLLFINNSICSIFTPGARYAPAYSGTIPGTGPTTIMKLTDTDIENTSIVNFSTGTDCGIVVEVSHSSFDNIFISGVSQTGMSVQIAEPFFSNTLSNIRLRYCGSGLVLASNNNSFTTEGGVITNITILRCGQKSNWGAGLTLQQSFLDIESGTWSIKNGICAVKLSNGDSTVPYAIQLGFNANALALISLEDIQFSNYSTGAYNINGTQNNLILNILDCGGVSSVLNGQLTLQDSTTNQTTLAVTGTPAASTDLVVAQIGATNSGQRAQLNIANTAAINTANKASLVLLTQSSTQSRTTFQIDASLDNTTDATRESTVTFTAAVAGVTSTVMRFIGAALTLFGPLAMGSNKITGLANGSASTDAAAFGQIPTALPPNGSAGGSLSGTYPNPTVSTNANLTGPVTSIGNATAVANGAITSAMITPAGSDKYVQFNDGGVLNATSGMTFNKASNALLVGGVDVTFTLGQLAPIASPTFTGTTTIPTLKITTGSNASAGTGTLSSGTVTISTSAVTANSLIFLTDRASSLTNVGVLSVTAKSAGVSFTVTSGNALDTSIFNWLIIN